VLLSQLDEGAGIKTQKLIDWHYVLGLLFLPLLLVGIAFLVAYIEGLTRYNPAYFNTDYQRRYASRDTLLANLETALRDGDRALLAEIQGTRSVPDRIKPLPNIRFIIFWNYSGRYSNYLFMDTSNYYRYMQHLKIVNQRYVVIPESFYYYIDSGHWIAVVGPIIAFWWVLVILFTIGVWFYRSMSAYQEKLFKNTRKS